MTIGISQGLMSVMRIMKVGKIRMGGDLEVVGGRGKGVMKEDGTVKINNAVRKNAQS